MQESDVSLDAVQAFWNRYSAGRFDPELRAAIESDVRAAYDRGRRDERADGEQIIRLLHKQLSENPYPDPFGAWARLEKGAKLWLAARGLMLGRSSAPKPPADFGIGFDGTLAKRSQDAPPAPPETEPSVPCIASKPFTIDQEGRIRAIADERIKAREKDLSGPIIDFYCRFDGAHASGLRDRIEALERERADGSGAWDPKIRDVVDAARWWRADCERHVGKNKDTWSEAGVELCRALDALSAPPTTPEKETPAEPSQVARLDGRANHTERRKGS